ncbi:Dcp1p-Dcp2p decapping enzyme complex alpha subunit [Geranomyces variabilis]|uniref:mRNA guanylyltransferase n=1 Tax=Geranomyces variabilis TaxID=109894 RepID=A0AAD5XQB5_9FUNG|nr:Dcp1p-Dcp2p decapping enzyme complex alpha subunit [Geranomyces variabilis]
MASPHGSTQHPAAPSAGSAAARAPTKTQLPGKIGIPVQAEYANELRELVQDTLDYRHDGFAGSLPVALTKEHRQALEREDYYVCEKSDGVRYLMLLKITQSGPATFLIDRANDLHYVEKLHFPLPSTSGDIVKFHADTLMDGELVVDVDGPHKTLTFLVFDFMLSNGVKLTHEPYNRRLGIFQRDVLAPYDVHLKMNPELKTMQPFRLAIKAQQRSYGLGRVFEDITKQKHGNDGLIFTSVNLPYTAGTCPQILKWKPPELSTVDFQIKVDYDRDRKPRYSIFIADCGIHKFYDCLSLEPELSIQWKTSLPDGRIGEFRWDPSWPTYVWDAGYVGTERRGGWRFVRFRDDKSVANDITVLEDTKKAIDNGVSRDMLLGWLENIRSNWKHREQQATLPPRPPQDRKFSAIATPATPAMEYPSLGDHRRKSSSGSSMAEFTMSIARKASIDRSRKPENGASTTTSTGVFGGRSGQESLRAAGNLTSSPGDAAERRDSVGAINNSQSVATARKSSTLPVEFASSEAANETAPARKKSLTEMMAHMPKGIRLKKAWPSAESTVAPLLMSQGDAILREEPSPLDDEDKPSLLASQQEAQEGEKKTRAVQIMDPPPSPNTADRLPTVDSSLASEASSKRSSEPVPSNFSSADATGVKQESATPAATPASPLESGTGGPTDVDARPRRDSTTMDMDENGSRASQASRLDTATPRLSSAIPGSGRLTPDHSARGKASDVEASTTGNIAADHPTPAAQTKRLTTPKRTKKASESPTPSKTQTTTPKKKQSRKTSSLHVQKSPQKSASPAQPPAKEPADQKRKNTSELAEDHRASDAPNIPVGLTGRNPVDMTVDLPPPPVVLMTAPRPVLGDEDIYEDVETGDPSPSAPSTDRQPASIDAMSSQKLETKKPAKSPRKRSIKPASNSSAGVSTHRRTASTPYLPMSGSGGSMSYEIPDSRRPSVANQRRGSLHSAPNLVPIAPGLVALPPSDTGPYIVGADGSPHYLAPSDPRNIIMAGYVAYSSDAAIGLVPMPQSSPPPPQLPSRHHRNLSTSTLPDVRRHSSVAQQHPQHNYSAQGFPVGPGVQGSHTGGAENVRVLYGPSMGQGGAIYVETPAASYYGYAPRPPPPHQVGAPQLHPPGTYGGPADHGYPGVPGSAPASRRGSEAAAYPYHQQYQQMQPSQPQLQPRPDPSSPPAPPSSPHQSPAVPSGKSGRSSAKASKATKAPKISKAAAKRATLQQQQEQPDSKDHTRTAGSSAPSSSVGSRHQQELAPLPPHHSPRAPSTFSSSSAGLPSAFMAVPPYSGGAHHQPHAHHQQHSPTHAHPHAEHTQSQQHQQSNEHRQRAPLLHSSQSYPPSHPAAQQHSAHPHYYSPPAGPYGHEGPPHQGSMPNQHYPSRHQRQHSIPSSAPFYPAPRYHPYSQQPHPHPQQHAHPHTQSQQHPHPHVHSQSHQPPHPYSQQQQHGHPQQPHAAHSQQQQHPHPQQPHAQSQHQQQQHPQHHHHSHYHHSQQPQHQPRAPAVVQGGPQHVHSAYHAPESQSQNPPRAPQDAIGLALHNAPPSTVARQPSTTSAGESAAGPTSPSRPGGGGGGGGGAWVPSKRSSAWMDIVMGGGEPDDARKRAGAGGS